MPRFPSPQPAPAAPPTRCSERVWKCSCRGFIGTRVRVALGERAMFWLIRGRLTLRSPGKGGVDWGVCAGGRRAWGGAAASGRALACVQPHAHAAPGCMQRCTAAGFQQCARVPACTLPLHGPPDTSTRGRTDDDQAGVGRRKAGRDGELHGVAVVDELPRVGAVDDAVLKGAALGRGHPRQGCEGVAPRAGRQGEGRVGRRMAAKPACMPPLRRAARMHGACQARVMRTLSCCAEADDRARVAPPSAPARPPAHLCRRAR